MVFFGGGIHDVKPFWEIFNQPNGTHLVNNLAISEGQSFYVDVFYDSVSHVATFTLENLSTNTVVTPSSGNVSAYYSGDTADFIVERPAVNGSLVLLRKQSQDFQGSEKINLLYVNAYLAVQQDSYTMYATNNLMTNVNGTTTQSDTFQDCGPGPGYTQ